MYVGRMGVQITALAFQNIDDMISPKYVEQGDSNMLNFSVVMCEG